MSTDNRNFVYKHEKEYELRYTDMDSEDRLKLSSLLSVMDESACFSADELGFGYEVIKKKNLGFILVNWYVKLERPIVLGEKVRVITWPIKPQRLQVFRDFELYCGDEKVGAGVSRWCIVDLADFRFKPMSVIFDEVNIEYNDFRSIEFNDWKLPAVPEGEEGVPHTVVYSDYDHYNHVNNTRYADYLMDVFGVEFLKTHAISSVQITYVKQCKEGEVLTFKKAYQNGFYLVEGCVDGESRVRYRISFDEV